MTVKQRLTQPTPPFFKKIRNIGLLVASIGATFLAAPMELPAKVAKVAEYLAIAGTVASSISQATTEPQPAKRKKVGA